VVTQPSFVAERGDQYLAEVPATDLADLWRGRSLVEAGVMVAAGTDAPFGTSDPWLAIRAAVRRVTISGQTVGAKEAVSLKTALTWWWGTGRFPATPRDLKAGAPADLVILSVPLREAVEGDGRVPVRATFVDGKIVTHRSG
jgi:predicted amidohydrolase YtcJ